MEIEAILMMVIRFQIHHSPTRKPLLSTKDIVEVTLTLAQIRTVLGDEVLDIG